MTETRKLRVFLCHSSQDKPVVRELYQRLNAEGWIDPWLDEEILLPGQDWDMEIEKAVEAADAVIVCLSNNSVSKEGYVQKELKLVLDIALEKTEETIFIIPLRLDDVQPPRRLKSWHYVDYFPPNNKIAGYSKLLKSLGIKSLLDKPFDNQIQTPYIDKPKSIEILDRANEVSPITKVNSFQTRIKTLLIVVARSFIVGVVFCIVGVLFIPSENFAVWQIATFTVGAITNIFVGYKIPSVDRYQSAIKGVISGFISGLVFYPLELLVSSTITHWVAFLIVALDFAIISAAGGLLSGIIYKGNAPK